MGQTRKRFYGAFFLAFGLMLTLPDLSLLDQWRHGQAIQLSFVSWIGVAVCSIGAAAAIGGGARWLLGFK